MKDHIKESENISYRQNEKQKTKPKPNHTSNKGLVWKVTKLNNKKPNFLNGVNILAYTFSNKHKIRY